MLKGILVLIWELDMNLELTLEYIVRCEMIFTVHPPA